MSKTNQQKVAINTLLLYFRMFLNMAITLYTSRIILKYLGIEDYGIYNVVGGLVSMFSLISGSLSNSVSRFITFELGRGNEQKLRKIFSISVLIHIILSGIIFLAVESIGVWFLNAHMSINDTRINAANWVLQFSLFTFIVNIISVPYNAIIIAYEKMKAFAYVSILEVTLKLIAVYLLIISPIDRLIMYSFLLFLIAVLLRMIYGIYCKTHFNECTIRWTWNKDIIMEMSQFAGWNFLGSLANIFKTQGVNILVNIFHGATLNAAQGIATQINNAVQSFSENFMTALNPQIIKNYANGDINKSLNMVKVGARLSFYLMFLLSFPILCETSFILKLWLQDFPLYTIIFTKLTLIYILIEVLSKPIITIINASGRIRAYQLGISILLVLNFPISFLVLKLGYAPSSIYIISILIAISAFLFRTYILHKQCNIPYLRFLYEVLSRPILITIIAIIIQKILSFIQADIERIILTFTGGIIFILISIIFVGLNSQERNILKDLLHKKRITNDYNKIR